MRRGGVRSLVLAAWLLSVPLLVASCSNVMLISEYDETTDRAVTELHRKVEMFLLYLDEVAGTPEGEFAEHQDYYREVEVDISAIAIRAASRTKNELQVDQVRLLESSWRDFRALHRLGLTRDQIPPARTALNVIFAAILKLEFEKRRGR